MPPIEDKTMMAMFLHFLDDKDDLRYKCVDNGEFGRWLFSEFAKSATKSFDDLDLALEYLGELEHHDECVLAAHRILESERRHQNLTKSLN